MDSSEKLQTTALPGRQMIVLISVLGVLGVVVAAVFFVFHPKAEVRREDIFFSSSPGASEKEGDFSTEIYDVEEWFQEKEKYPGLASTVPATPPISPSRAPSRRTKKKFAANITPKSKFEGKVTPGPRTSSAPRVSAPTRTSVPVPRRRVIPKPAPSVSLSPAAPPKKRPKIAPSRAKPRVSSPAPRRRQYWVQVGSFRSYDRALLARKDLTTGGVEGVITTYQPGERSPQLYRVRIGAFSDKQEAARYAQKFRQLSAYRESFVIQNF